MTLIKSISGIRGTVGGSVGKSLSPFDIVKYVSSFAAFIKLSNSQSKTIVIGRDARLSGDMVSRIVSGTLMSLGFDVIDVGLSTTPTIEVAVVLQKADGGIIITASHNPINWNALKLLNSDGEFLSQKDGEKILSIAEKNEFIFSQSQNIGNYIFDNSFNDKHIDEVLNLRFANLPLIKESKFKVVIDGVNSSGGFMIPKLLDKLSVDYVKLYCDPNGLFSHNPEPLEENLTEISKLVVSTESDFGIVVDPDVDRLALVCHDGSMFGEEYTLVAVADYILSKNPGNTVSNLSSTRALKDITEKYNCKYEASAVGEVNVVEKMKKINAVIGGEGNGGIIYPEIHYGRDALVGIVLILSLLAEKQITLKELKELYPKYYMSKNKIQLTNSINIDSILSNLKDKYSSENITTIDGLKIDFNDGWVHLRKSNTEPIIRIYSESISEKKANHLSESIISDIKQFLK